MRKIIWIVLGIIGLCVVCGAAGALFWPKPSNPPVRAEPQWDSPRTRELAKRACFDCHSNETVWPWYTNIPPVAFLLRHDVDEGRSKMNFSEFDRPQQKADEAAEVVAEGEMPMPIYLPLHPEAKLTAEEKQELINGLLATLGGEVGEGSSDD